LDYYIEGRVTHLLQVEPPLALEDSLPVNGSVAIPRSELDVRASRAGGPGGQHVNTSSTRVEVTWNVRTSAALNGDQRLRVLTALASRLASDTRSQRQNRELAEQRLAEVVRRALVVPKKRKATRPTRSSVERRLEGKKRSGEKKKGRRWSGDD
jgi:ribosome-associated protein